MDGAPMEPDLWDALVRGGAYLTPIAIGAGSSRGRVAALLADVRRGCAGADEVRRACRASRAVLPADLARFAEELLGSLAERSPARPAVPVGPREAAEAMLACWDELAVPDRLVGLVGEHDPQAARLVRVRRAVPRRRGSTLRSALGAGAGR